MDVEIQRPTEALDDHHGAAAPIADAVTVRAAPEEPEDRADTKRDRLSWLAVTWILSP